MNPSHRSTLLSTEISAAASIRSAPLRAIYRYWQDLSRDGRIPCRTEIDPIRISRSLGHVILVEWDADQGDFRFRIVGATVDDIHQTPSNRRHFSAVWTGTVLEAVRSEYRKPLRLGRPWLDQVQKVGVDGSDLSFERVLLPMASHSRCTEPDMLFGGADHFGRPGLRAQTFRPSA